MTQLNAADEWSRLRTALKPLISQRRLMLEKLEVPTLEALQHRLQGQDIHILHFIGHGGFNTAADSGDADR